MYISELATSIKPNILTSLEERRAELAMEGKDIINLSIGTPDIPPAPHIIQALIKAAEDPENYKYTITIPHAAAIAAITGPQDQVALNRLVYRERRDAFCSALRDIGWDVPMTPATMFTWFHLPDGETDSDIFCRTLLEKAGVMCVPGSYFGNGGNDYVRFALTKSPEILREAASRIGEFI